jgi:hypothetical protein
MYMLGHKNLSNYRLGLKSHSTHSLGNKQYSGIKNGQTVGTLSPDGVIHNYSNSPEVAREPMRGVPINTNKTSHTMRIEKPRKQSESKSNYYV